MCAFLNLYYYWKPFGVQPFEFISISDALAYAVPFLILSAFMLTPVFISEIFWPSNYPHKTDKGPKGSYTSFLLGMVVALNLVVVLLAEIGRWIVIPVFIGLISGIIPLAIRLGSLKKFSKYLPSKPVRVFVFLIVCCLPAASVTHAVMARAGILERSNYYTVSGADINSVNEKGELAYIGHLGEYIFLLRDDSTVAYRREDLKKLELHKGKPVAHNTSLKADGADAPRP
jgi:hypothetical protein